jgi:hypothetical protein
MAQTTINLSLDEEIKKQVDDYCEKTNTDIVSLLTEYLKSLSKTYKTIQGAMLVDKDEIPKSHAVKFGGWEDKMWVSEDFDNHMELIDSKDIDTIKAIIEKYRIV